MSNLMVLMAGLLNGLLGLKMVTDPKSKTVSERVSGAFMAAALTETVSAIFELNVNAKSNVPVSRGWNTRKREALVCGDSVNL